MTGNPHTCLCFPYLHGYGFCMCSCVCMHMCPGYTQASVHLHVEARGRRCLLQSHPTFLRLHLSLTGWPESPGAHLCLCIPNTGVTGIVCSSLLFCCEAGDRNSGPRVCSSPFRHQTIFSVFFLSFKFTFKIYV